MPNDHGARSYQGGRAASIALVMTAAYSWGEGGGPGVISTSRLAIGGMQAGPELGVRGNRAVAHYLQPSPMDRHCESRTALVLRHAIGLVERTSAPFLAGETDDPLRRVHRQFLKAGSSCPIYHSAEPVANLLHSKMQND